MSVRATTRHRFISAAVAVSALALVALPSPAVAGAPPGSPCAGMAEPPIAPLDSLTYLTSTFGEYRDGYFHAGIDLGTFGETGFPILAVDDGSVVRIRASGVGYGRAIYFRLDSGPVAVYAHLESFAPELAAYVEGRQDALGRYEVDLYPDEGRFRFTRGEELGTTGESGAGPPHLHFEMRNAASDVAVNPQTCGIVPDDEAPPSMAALWVAPASHVSLVNGHVDPVRVPLKRAGKGRYLAADTVSVEGEVTVSAELHDAASQPRRRLGVYRLNLLVDGVPTYEARLDEVPYADKREVDLVYEREQAARGNKRVRKLYRSPGATLGVHKNGDGIVRLAPDGGGNGEAHRVEVLASDFAGNMSRAEIVCRASKPSPKQTAVPRARAARSILDPTQVVGEDTSAGPADRYQPRRDGGAPYLRIAPRTAYRHVNLYVSDRSGIGHEAVFEVSGAVGFAPCSIVRRSGTEVIARFNPAGLVGPLRLSMSPTGVDDDPVTLDTDLVAAPAGEAMRVQGGALRVEIPSGATFDDQVVWTEVVDVRVPEEIDHGLTRISSSTAVHPGSAILKKPATISFPAPEYARGVGVYARNPKNGRWVFIGGDLGDGRITATTRRLGEYALVRDERAPVIARTYPKEGATVTERRPRIAARVADTGSGFTWRELAVTVDGKPLIAEWDPEAGWIRGRPRAPLAIGAHSVTVSARDRAGNATETTFEFFVK